MRSYDACPYWLCKICTSRNTLQGIFRNPNKVMDSQLEPTYLYHMTINIKRAVVKGIRIYQKLPQIKVYYFINVLVYTLLTLKNTNFFLFSLFKKFSSFSISLITFFFGIFLLSCHGFLQIYFKELQFLDFHSRLPRDTFLKKT